MIDVVCFCGCTYSFHGDTGACPTCGETVTFRRASCDERDETSEEQGRLSPVAGELASNELAA